MGGVKEELIKYFFEQGRKQGLEEVRQKGLEKGREELLYKVVRKMVLKGESTIEICDLLDVSEDYVLKVRSKVF